MSDWMLLRPAKGTIPREKSYLPSRKLTASITTNTFMHNIIITRAVSVLLAFIITIYIILNYKPESHQNTLFRQEVAEFPKECHSHLFSLHHQSPTLACRIETARVQHNEKLKRQSRTVEEAILTYTKRYKRHPPKHFEVWVDFALQHNSAIIDDYDQIEKDLTPFRRLKGFNKAAWQQKISSIKRADPGEMLGSVSVLGGEIIVMGPEEGSMSSDTLESILQPIAPLLPDLSLLYNWYAEPRILASHRHQKESLPGGGDGGGHDFTIRRKKRGKEWHEKSNNVFANFTQSNTLDVLGKSCPSNTLTPQQQNSNWNNDESNDFSIRDFCKSASKIVGLDNLHGFFAGPDGFLPTYSLVPLLSRAKLSTFDDILAPNVCYGHQDYRYWNQIDTIPFANKSHSLYWRGSMSGISTTKTNWIHGHRHRLIGYLQTIRAFIEEQKSKKEDSKQQILLSPSLPPSPPPLSLQESLGQAKWSPELQSTLMRMPSSAFDTAFTAAAPNCPEDVCNAVSQEMPIQKAEHIRESFKHQFALDLDGQSMSCRYYSLLESNSVVFKQTIWGEWHDDRIMPWLHYVPIHVDLLRHDIPLYLDWFINTKEGQEYGELIAHESRKWTERALRKIDLTIYLFRIFVELADIYDSE